ncbi:DUF6509 family protein [Jeotgalibacillus salarius]|uniref:Pullulanase n=1 Tax=Jeotgalibacillus salarius TaxID=546023 RepID=A0A4Y8LEZ7_9BACL|nr:DUF6509 family protein [Jeotgalibacillus salarius]TFD99570.1 pullulanase [Jeotgalibacillus salarius]
MDIKSYTVEKINDSFGILTGDRFEFMLEVEVEEDDELYQDGGVSIKALYKVEDGEEQLLKYDLIKTSDGDALDFELEDEEIQAIKSFCSSRWQEALEKN